MTESRSLTSVHEALNNATFASKSIPGDPVAFRLDTESKEEVMKICEKHGTNISQFLRQCCLGLINDYRDPSRG